MSEKSTADSHSSRLDWLDALRGLAALLVVWEHFAPETTVLPGIPEYLRPWMKTGDVGVFLFFLISGYIIPASLERRGSLRSFWIGRFFRLYPMVALVVVVATFLQRSGNFPQDDFAVRHRVTSLVAHGTMLQDLLGVPNIVGVFWTLSYEMVFYLVVCALFVRGVNRHSPQIAVLLATSSLLLFPSISQGKLWALFETRSAVAAVAVVLAAGLALSLSGRRPLMALGSGTLGAMAVTLVIRNGSVQGWEGLLILATMFLGTTVFRAHSGHISVQQAWGAFATVFVLAVASAARHAEPDRWGTDPSIVFRHYVLGLSIASLLFAGGLLLRNQRLPRTLTWLGEISFSVYLVHRLLLQMMHGWIDHLSSHIGNPHSLGPLLARLLLSADFVLVVVACAALTYRFVEKPGQHLGRVVDNWWQTRLRGDDTPTGRGRMIGRQRDAVEAAPLRQPANP